MVAKPAKSGGHFGISRPLREERTWDQIAEPLKSASGKRATADCEHLAENRVPEGPKAAELWIARLGVPIARTNPKLLDIQWISPAQLAQPLCLLSHQQVVEPSVTRSASGKWDRRREFGEQYNSFPLISFQIFERHSREPTPRQAQRLSVQFSMFNLGTRPNSRVLFVTSVTPRLRAWAAMNRSFAPIIVPRVFKWARIFA